MLCFQTCRRPRLAETGTFIRQLVLQVRLRVLHSDDQWLSCSTLSAATLSATLSRFGLFY